MNVQAATALSSMQHSVMSSPRLPMALMSSGHASKVVPKLQLGGMLPASQSSQAASHSGERSPATSRSRNEHAAQMTACTPEVPALASVPQLALAGLRKHSSATSLSTPIGLDASPDRGPFIPKLAMTGLLLKSPGCNSQQASNIVDIAAVYVGNSTARPVPGVQSAAKTSHGASDGVFVPAIPLLPTASLGYTAAGKSIKFCIYKLIHNFPVFCQGDLS